MTEKPKEKVRQVIGKATIQKGYLTNGACTFFYDMDGTDVEIVALVDTPEPKRKLVQGPSKWKLTSLVDAHRHLINDDGVIAEVKELVSGQWLWSIPNKHGYVETREPAQRAVEEALAAAGLYGFRWKEEEPHIERWECTICGLPCRIEITTDDTELSSDRSKESRVSCWLCPCGKYKPNWHEVDYYKAEKESKEENHD